MFADVFGRLLLYGGETFFIKRFCDEFLWSSRTLISIKGGVFGCSFGLLDWVLVRFGVWFCKI